MTLKNNQHFRVRFWGGGGGHQKAYVVYAFINVDNCERPLSEMKSSGAKRVMRQNKKIPFLLVFACNVGLQLYAMSKYFSAKRVIRQAAAAS